MKITETIERDCCDPNKDFTFINHGRGITTPAIPAIGVCYYCNQLWFWDMSTGPCGDKESGWEKVKRIEVVT